MANNFNKCRLSILGIIVHMIVHEEEDTRIEEHNNCLLITKSAWRNLNGAASGGVGIVVSKKAENAVAEIKPINNRIVVAIFNGNP